MKFYKKLILTLSGAGMLMGCTHKELEEPIHAVVVGMTTTIGDTVRYTTTNRNEVSLSACVPLAELQQRHMINNLRERLGQEKQR